MVACEYPPLVTIPEGREATREEMLEAQTRIRNYVTAMESYLVCVGEELTVAGENAPEVFKSIIYSRHNVAMAELETVANHFNEQLQIYRCRRPKRVRRAHRIRVWNQPANAPGLPPSDHGDRCRFRPVVLSFNISSTFSFREEIP